MKLNLIKLLTFHIALITGYTAISQNETEKNFNLGFEISKNTKTAKGWHSFGGGNYDLHIDPNNAHTGKNSAVIEFKDGTSNYYAWVYKIPAIYDGEKIKLTGYIKTENVAGGYAGLWMRIDPSAGFDNMYNRGVTGTTDWQQYEIEYEYKASKAEDIVVGGLLVGKGKMWIDDLEITIDGQKIENVSLYTKPLLEGKKRKRIARKIKLNKTNFSLESTKKLDESLAPLIKHIGDKKIIAIGEDTHGTSEYYKLRSALTKKLILEKQFNTIVLENPYDDIELLIQNLQKEDIDILMRKHLFPIYQTKEMKAFLVWLKNEAPQNVKFKGCDDSFWVIDQLLEKELAVSNDAKVNALFNNFKDETTMELKEYSAKYPEESKHIINENELYKKAYTTLTALEDQLIATNKYTTRLKELLSNAKNSYINFVKIVDKKPIQSRDEIMADRVAFFAKNPTNKVIVWAHNAHISNTVIIDNEIGLMGKDLKKEFGRNYHAIGLSSLNGTYSYMENRFINSDHEYDDLMKQETLQFQPGNSWEILFDEIDSYFYFNTQNFPSYKISENLKLVGYGKESENDYYNLSPFTMFDTIFYIKNTSATNPLFK